MLTFGVDTSNYATSLAVVNTAQREVVCALKRFLPIKEGATGLRQCDAVFHHTVALPAMLKELGAQCELRAVEAVGVSGRPRPVNGSYMPCFLAGVSFAAAFAAGKSLPLVHTSHQQGHLAAALLGSGAAETFGRPLLFFHASGGTTELLLAAGHTIEKTLGGTDDLYAGQAIDRLGVRLGLPFPAGEALSALAQCWRGPAPKPRVSVKGLKCHFSGLQNQCEAMLQKGEAPAYVAYYCLAYLAEAFTVLLLNARQLFAALPILCAGGVMCSELIRARLGKVFDKLYFAPPHLSSDNAVGTALIAAGEAQNG